MRRHLLWLALPLALATLLAPTSDAAVRVRAPGFDVQSPGIQGEDSLLPGDADLRVGRVLPSAAQRSIARRLGAQVTWNPFGTPKSLYNRSGYLSGPSKGDAVDVARAWVGANAALFRLDK